MTTAAAENSTFLAVLTSSGGTAHNLELVRQGMVNVRNFQYLPDRPVLFAAGDKLDIDWLNATTQKYGTEVIYGKRY
ncbi:MAG: hypothetical protein H7831_06805 [Magnetococcus sp. WYHC-3]